MSRGLVGRARALLGRKFVQDVIALQLGRFAATGVGLLSTLVVTRVVGPAGYGVYGLAGSIFSLFAIANISGAGQSTQTRLPKAIATGNASEALDVMAYHMQSSLLFTLGIAGLMLLFAPAYAAATQGSASTGWLAALLAFTGPADATVVLVSAALQSKRQMRALSSLSTASQVILSVVMIALALLSGTPEALIAARLIHSYTILIVSIVLYGRLRTQGEMALPTLRAVTMRSLRVSPRPFWRFGVANAFDRNLASFMTQFPLQLVGMVGGDQAAGYLALGLRGYAQVAVFTSALFDAMQAVVPRAVARHEFTKLWGALWRAVLGLGIGSVLVYGAMAMAAPFIIAPLFGREWIPAIPAIILLAYYGALTTTGGVFGPVYRSLGMMRIAVSSKVLAMALVLPLGVLLLQNFTVPDLSGYTGLALLPAGLATMGQASAAAAAGALIVNGVFTVSVGIMAVVVMRVVYKRAKAQAA
ncbi:MAG: oligosaccharide flippase family protein [Anaerolineae bacterium]